MPDMMIKSTKFYSSTGVGLISPYPGVQGQLLALLGLYDIVHGPVHRFLEKQAFDN